MGMFDVFTGKNAKAGAQANAWGAQQGMAAAGGLFGNAQDAIRAGVNQADAFYAPLGSTVEKGMAGYDAYGDASGVNGAEGLSRARALFTQTPGYQEGMDSGVNAIMRTRAARGSLNSGGAEQDLLKFGNDYASQRFNDYRAGLAPYLNAPGQQMALAGQRAGLYTGQGTALANILAQQAGVTNAGYNATGKAMGDYYAANDVAAKNMLGAGMKGAELLGQAYGGLGGMSGIKSLFGGGAGAPMNIKPTGMLI